MTKKKIMLGAVAALTLCCVAYAYAQSAKSEACKCGDNCECCKCEDCKCDPCECCKCETK
ncbi:MAG: hypothetical protein IK077_01075 [Thermoguttaceae bacterium]|nr:hypothetical protein [Thermoguttaceae bacterium]